MLGVVLTRYHHNNQYSEELPEEDLEEAGEDMHKKGEDDDPELHYPACHGVVDDEKHLWMMLVMMTMMMMEGQMENENCVAPLAEDYGGICSLDLKSPQDGIVLARLWLVGHRVIVAAVVVVVGGENFGVKCYH